MSLLEITKGILLLKVPFEDLYTSVFFVETAEGLCVIDCATTAHDVDTYIVPALRKLGGAPVRLLLTHSHGDHAGGAARLLECYPTMAVHTLEPLLLPRFSVLSDGEVIAECLQAVALQGHSAYSMGYLHLPSRTLLSGDCLQLAGVGKYVNGIKYPDRYLRSIEALKSMEIDRIVASHDYVPLGYLAEGRDAVARYLDTCAQICISKKGE